MAAPDFVPNKPTDKVRTYSSPPARNRSWMADRPGDVVGEHPTGEGLGTPGPDQGYAIKLARSFDGRLKLGSLNEDDVVAGCVAIASKRSGLFGRAPVVHDLTAAFTIFGFLDDAPDADLVTLREELFPQVASAHHYSERREIVDLVQVRALHRPHAQIITDYQTGWRQKYHCLNWLRSPPVSLRRTLSIWAGCLGSVSGDFGRVTPPTCGEPHQVGPRCSVPPQPPV